MSRSVIDLRSDTVTRPSAEMRQAMAEAEVGDDVFLEDPTVKKLEARAAEIFGREAGLYVPSGTMGNLVCLMAHTEPGHEVICDSDAHVYNYEMASMASIAGVLPRVVPAERGIMRWSQIESAIRPKTYYRAQTALVALENTHNMAGGTVYPPELVSEIVEGAHAEGLKVHLDGARIFNAAFYLGRDVASLTDGIDSVQFCLSKGLGAPIGSVVVGSRDLIEQCRRYRKMLGGGMRQVGVVAAAGLVALETGPARLGEDHANAQLLAKRLAQVPGLEIQPERVQTNIIIFALNGPATDAAGFVTALEGKGLLAIPIDRRRVRMVTHRDVSRQEVQRAGDVVGELVETLGVGVG